LASLFTEKRSQPYLVTAERLNHADTSSGSAPSQVIYSNKLPSKFSPSSSERDFSRSEIAGDGSVEIPMSRHEGEEFNYIIKGSLRFRIDGEEVILNEGDSVYYNSGLPHGMVAAGDADCQFLAVVIAPKGKNIKVGKGWDLRAVTGAVKYNYIEKPIFEKFVKVKENAKGQLESLQFLHDESFNFAFDVVDEIRWRCFGFRERKRSGGLVLATLRKGLIGRRISLRVWGLARVIR
jgi:acetyl-CoA synthetase